jgi:hypothetical protein
MKIKIISALILLAALLTSCKKDLGKDTANVNPEAVNEKYFVDENTIRKLAINFHFMDKNDKTQRTIQEIVSLKDQSGRPAVYFVNYANNQGFAIFSADYRSNALTGYSQTGNLDVNDLAPALQQILKSKVGKIQELRKQAVNNMAGEISNSWELVMNDQSAGTPLALPPDGGTEGGTINCSQLVSQKSKPELLVTTWGQGCGYNANCPIKSCTNTCERSLTGCVATAMAQVMYYHRWPSSYGWSTMKTNQGTAECAKLMRDIGDAVSMSYACDGSLASTQTKAAPAFKNNFKYASSTTYSSFAKWDAKSELDGNRPVLMRGSKSSGGHAWVTDGYNYKQTKCYDLFWFHLNWGWNGGSNGYYAYGDMLGYGDLGMVVVRK